MISIKKVTLAVLALSVSAAASAGMYTPPPAPAPAPSVPVWEFGIQALYIQSNNIENITNLEHDVVPPVMFYQLGAAPASDTPTQSLDPDSSWGFRLEAGYHYDTDSDVNINWTHFTNDADPQTIHGDNVNVFIGTAFLADPNPQIDPNSWTTVVSSEDSKLDQVNLELGRTARITQRFNARIHGGLSFVRVEQDITQVGSANNGVNFETDTFSNNSKFQGIGPRAGLDLEYLCGHGFSLVGGAAVSLYVGDKDYDSTLVDVIDGVVQSNQTINSDSDLIVPAAEARIGVKYAHPTSHGDLDLEVGYLVSQYWNSVETQDVNQNPTSADFSFDGLYLGAKMLFS